MQGPVETWQQAADSFEMKLGAVTDDLWDAPTACGDWTVRELVDHTLFWQANLAAVVGAPAAVEDGWDSIKATIAGALEDPSCLEGAIEGGPMNGMPRHQAIGIATADVLVHGWDLARAVGTDDTLPRDAVEAVHMGLQRAPEAMLRSPQMFGPEVQVPDDASAQDKLLGFVGRHPS
jgi:uncharacterized protein (TIGR03086 family)